MQERAKTELELIAEEARTKQSGVVFDASSVRTVPKSAELLVRLPVTLQNSIMQGKRSIIIDFMGNTHITELINES
jgi:hypothetical protein